MKLMKLTKMNEGDDVRFTTYYVGRVSGRKPWFVNIACTDEHQIETHSDVSQEETRRQMESITAQQTPTIPAANATQSPILGPHTIAVLDQNIDLLKDVLPQ